MSENSINIDNPEEKTIIAERVEDGHVHLEIVKEGEILERITVPESLLGDGHLHDGMVVVVTEQGTLEPDPHGSAIREKRVSEKIDRIGKRPSEL